MIEKTTRLARGFLASSLQAAFPPGCLNCDTPLEEPGHLCGSCWPQMTFLGEPCCASCGLPFEYSPSSSMICGTCLRAPPSYDKARAVLEYDDASRDMVLSFKHADRTRNAPAFASWMYRAATDLVAECDILVAVPLHPFRLLRRRYNQAALLAREMSRLSGKPALPDLLLRTRPTPPQGGLSAAARKRNVEGVFTPNPKKRALLENARILLIDDVMTTGATVDACSRVLLAAGAAKTDILTLCRVVRATGLAI